MKIARQVAVDQRCERAVDRACGEDGVLLADVASRSEGRVHRPGERGGPRDAGVSRRCRIQVDLIKRAGLEGQIAGDRHRRAGGAVAGRECAAGMDRHRGRIDATRAGQRAVDINVGRAVDAVEHHRAGIDVDLVDAGEGVVVHICRACAELKVDGVARSLADDVSGDGAAIDIEHVGMRRQLDCAVDGAGILIDDHRAHRRAGIDRGAAGAADGTGVHDRRAAGKGHTTVDVDARPGRDRARIADAAGEGRDRSDINGVGGARDRAAVADATGEGRDSIDGNAIGTRDRARVGYAAREIRAVSDDNAVEGRRDRAGIADAARIADAIDKARHGIDGDAVAVGAR